MQDALECPRCKRNLTEATYENVRIDRCAECGGVWLDTGEMEQVLECYEKKFSGEQVSKAMSSASAGVTETENESVENCPICVKRMNPLNFNYSSGIIIDVCPTGHGLWFDGKELEAVQIHIEQWNAKSREIKNRFSPEIAQARIEAFSALDSNTNASAMGKPLYKIVRYAVDFVSSVVSGKDVVSGGES